MQLNNTIESNKSCPNFSLDSMSSFFIILCLVDDHFFLLFYFSCNDGFVSVVCSKQTMITTTYEIEWLRPQINCQSAFTLWNNSIECIRIVPTWNGTECRLNWIMFESTIYIADANCPPPIILWFTPHNKRTDDKRQIEQESGETN